MTQAFNLAQLANNLNTSGQLDATDGLTGSVPVANGGTGTNTLTANNLMVGNGTSSITFIAPSTSDNVLASNGSLWASTALSALGVFGKSLTSNGYQKLPGGIILQWGKYTTAVTNAATAITFPIAFPTACLQVNPGQNGTSYSQFAPSATSITTTGCSIYNNSIGQVVTWLAIGY